MQTIITTLMLLFSLNIFAQNDFTELYNEVNKQAEELRKELEAQDYYSEFEKTTYVGFTVDTFRIQRILNGKIEADFTTFAVLEAVFEAEKEYDKLLNKYYKVLLAFLTEEEDKEILKQAQRDWIKFRDSEKKLVALLAEEQYSGGGTMWSFSVSYDTMKITKQRVIELYNHISRFYEYGY